MSSPGKIIEDLMTDLSSEVKKSNDPYLKLDFFKEMVKWAGMKSKIDPDAGEGSKINEYRDALKTGGDSGGDRIPRTRARKSTFGTGDKAQSKGNGSAASFSTNPRTALGSFSGNGRDVHSDRDDAPGPDANEVSG